MLLHPADDDLIPVARDVLADGELRFELAAELIEKRHLDAGAERDRTLGRLELPGQDLQKRRLPRAIAPEDPDSFASQDIS